MSEGRVQQISSVLATALGAYIEEKGLPETFETEQLIVAAMCAMLAQACCMAEGNERVFLIQYLRHAFSDEMLDMVSAALAADEDRAGWLQ